MKFPFVPVSLAVVTGVLFLTCNKSPSMPPEEYRLNVNWTAAQGTMVVFADYTIPYETGKDDFAGMSAYTVPEGFLNPAASVTWNLTGKTATVHFVRTGQCLLFFTGTTPDDGVFTDSCPVTVGNPFSISGDAVVSAGDTARFFLAPRPLPSQMAAGITAEWSTDAVSSVLGVADTFAFSAPAAGSRSVTVSFVDAAHGDTVRLDTFPFIVGDFTVSASWPDPADSLAPLTRYSFSFLTGADPFDTMYAYTAPAGFLDPAASVTLDTGTGTGTVYLIAAGQCRLFLAGRAPGGRVFADSCLVTVRSAWRIAGDSALDIGDTAGLFLAPCPDTAALIPGTLAAWSAGGASVRQNVTDTFFYSHSVSDARQIIAALMDTVRGYTVPIDTFSLKFNEYRLAVDPPVQQDSLLLLSWYAFPYQTGPDPFDSMNAYVDPNSFINPAASLVWDTGANVIRAYFIREGQCRLHVTGRTPDGRLFTDSCPVTVINPFSITGDSAVCIGETARLYLEPGPEPASMAAGLTTEWRVNGVPQTLGIGDTLSLSDSIEGTCEVIASFVDAAHRDTARLDTFAVRIGNFRLSVDWFPAPDSLALFTLNAFSFQTGLDPFDTMYAYTEPAGFINPEASAVIDAGAKTGIVYFIREGQCRLFLAGRAPGGAVFCDSCPVTVGSPWAISGDTAVDIGKSARLFLVPQPSAVSMAPGVMVEWNASGTPVLLNPADTLDFFPAVPGRCPVTALFVDPVHGDTARIDTFSVRAIDFFLSITWAAHADTALLFRTCGFPYRTGADAFDSMSARTDPEGFINPAASVSWDTGAGTVSVHFIREGRCRLFLSGTSPDGRTFTDSCLFTVSNPFTICGDTAMGTGETAGFFLSPRPDPDSMAAGTEVLWSIDGPSLTAGLADTFYFSDSTTGTRPIAASFVDRAHGDTAALDTLHLFIGYRIRTIAFGTGSGTISPADPCVAEDSAQVFTITPAAGSVIARLFTGTAQTASVATYTWTNVTTPDSLKVMFFAAPALSKPVPSQGVSFRMGSDHPSLTFYGPAHLVTLTYGYFMDSTEVTQDDYFDLMGVAPSFFTGNVNRPVENMSWFDAALYCNERSKRHGLDTVYRYTTVSGTRGNGVTALGGLAIDYTKIGYRLPTEAECEYALRASSETEYYWGRGYPMATPDDTLAADSNAVWQHNSGGSTQTVASKRPNAWGFYDLIGNVAEFCNDWYAGYTSAWITDPVGPASGTQRVQRGGAWTHIVDHSFVSAGRYYQYPDIRSNFIGFRAVLPAAP